MRCTLLGPMDEGAHKKGRGQNRHRHQPVVVQFPQPNDNTDRRQHGSCPKDRRGKHPFRNMHGSPSICFTEEGIWGKETKTFRKKFYPPFPKPASAEPGLPSSKTLVFTNPCSRLSRVLETAERLFLPSCAIPAGRVNRRACRQAFTTPTAAPSRLSFFTSSPGRRTRPTARLQARHSWACRRDQASRRYSARRSPTSPQKARHR